MKPDSAFVRIGDNVNSIKNFLREIILSPRANIIKWSQITNQTPNLKVGYPAQHLASLITEVMGTATGARGDDLSDKTEVKACSRIDPLDKCNNCKGNVMRGQRSCPRCGSTNIKITNDSKWLIGVRNERELSMYLNEIPRMLFIIFDYPRFNENDYETMRISSYEIWNQSPRACNFRKLLQDYYYKIFLEHIRSNPNKNPAPKNFWPYSYQFYMCNPIKTFECNIKGINTQDFKIEVTHYIDPKKDRSDIESENMPVSLLKPEELDIISKQDKICGDYITETQRKYLILRDTSSPVSQKSEYHRGEK